MMKAHNPLIVAEVRLGLGLRDVRRLRPWERPEALAQKRLVDERALVPLFRKGRRRGD
jgi:hypothetical protein